MLSESALIKLLFGFKLKYLRQDQGLSLEDLAARTGLSKSYIHDIEKGKKYPKVDKISTLAKGLGVEYDFLVSRRAAKKMQPVVDLLSSDLLKEFPLATFGIQIDKLLELLVNTPYRVNAFIDTITGITRHYQFEREDLYFTALRSYQNLHDNYFAELEALACTLREQLGGLTAAELKVATLERSLLAHYGIQTERSLLQQGDALAVCRSYFSQPRKILYIRDDMSTAQERFILGRELAFQEAQWSPRPFETRILEAPDFDTLLHNFNASYVASALLMPEEEMVKGCRAWANSRSWNPQFFNDWLEELDVTPEMLLQRLTNILPHHFGIENLFFIRLQADRDLQHYEMTKELHLSRQHSPYANALDEHYCRRWVSVNIIKQARQRLSATSTPTILVDAQVSSYWATPHQYFCLSLARSSIDGPNKMSSVTLGLLVNDQLRNLFGFLSDPALAVRTVNTTCERCSVPDCEARIVPPLALEQGRRRKRIREQLDRLDA